MKSRVGQNNSWMEICCHIGGSVCFNGVVTISCPTLIIYCVCWLCCYARRMHTDSWWFQHVSAFKRSTICCRAFKLVPILIKDSSNQSVNQSVNQGFRVVRVSISTGAILSTIRLDPLKMRDHHIPLSSITWYICVSLSTT